MKYTKSQVYNENAQEDKLEHRSYVNTVIEGRDTFQGKRQIRALVDVIWSFCAGGGGVAIIICNAPLMSNEYLQRHLNTTALLQIMSAHEVLL